MHVIANKIFITLNKTIAMHLMCSYIFVVTFTISETKRDQRAKVIISIVSFILKGSKFNIQPYVKMNTM
jgi:hypothetical protein